MNPRNVIIWGGLAAFLVIVFFEARIVAQNLEVKDLSAYWAAAQLMEDNPYSAEKVQGLKQESGITNSPTLIMRNPPWTLVILFPLRWLDYFSTFALWTMLNVFVVSTCALVVWNLRGGNNPIWALLISMFFGPTLLLLRHGQIAGLVLLGYVGFLVCVEKERDWVAGIFLFFVFLKPHLALPFLLVLLFWSVRTRRYAVIVTCALCVVVASILVVSINPLIFSQYRSLFHEAPVWSTVYPNLGGILAWITGRQWVSFLLFLGGCAWSFYYWLSMRKIWSWKSHLPIILLVSLVTSYYSYGYDEVIVLPALLRAALKGGKKTVTVALMIVTLVMLACATEWVNAYAFGYMLNSWTATAWLLVYMISNRKKSLPPKINLSAYV